MARPKKTKTKHRVVMQSVIVPTEDSIISIVGDDPIPYPQFLRKIWIYWKENKLVTTERVD